MSEQAQDRPGDDPIPDTGVLTEQSTQVERPNLYRVILHNDDYTPMEFVVDILKRFFHKSAEEATEIMLAVHYKGAAVCGTYPYDIAETKVMQVTEAARESDYPLQCTTEKDS